MKGYHKDCIIAEREISLFKHLNRTVKIVHLKGNQLLEILGSYLGKREPKFF